MSINADLITSHSISVDSNGFTTERSYLVGDVTGTPESRLYNAMIQPGIPQLNDPHPILPDVRVTKLSARPQSSNSEVLVIASYSVPKADEVSTDAQQNPIDTGSVSLTTGLATESTWRDINGDFLRVVWSGSASIETAFKEAQVQRPQLSISFKRVETEVPKAAISRYLGRVNSSTWSGFPGKTWLCTKIDAKEDNEGRFNVDYGFSYKEDTWRFEGVLNLTQEQIAEFPPNVETQNGYAVYDVYRSADFNQLGISF